MAEKARALLTRDQLQALALIITRGAGHALDVGREGDDYEGIAEAALAYAHVEGWVSPTTLAGLRQIAHEHVTCRIALQASRERVEALELALAGIIGAACADGVGSAQRNLDVAIEHAATVLSTE